MRVSRASHSLPATEIYEAGRDAAIEALTKPGSKWRNERGALSIRKFRSIGKLRWQRGTGSSPINHPSIAGTLPRMLL